MPEDEEPEIDPERLDIARGYASDLHEETKRIGEPTMARAASTPPLRTEPTESVGGELGRGLFEPPVQPATPRSRRLRRWLTAGAGGVAAIALLGWSRRDGHGWRFWASNSRP